MKKITKSKLRELIQEEVRKQSLEEGFFDKAWTGIKDLVGAESPCDVAKKRLIDAKNVKDPRGDYKKIFQATFQVKEAIEDAESLIKRCKRRKTTKERESLARQAHFNLDIFDEYAADLVPEYKAVVARNKRIKAENDRYRARKEKEYRDAENKKARERAADRDRDTDKEEYCMSCRGGCPDGMTCEKRYSDKLGHSQMCCEKDEDYTFRSSIGLEEGSKNKQLTKTKLKQAIQEELAKILKEN